MSKEKQELKAQRREAFWAKRNINRDGRPMTPCHRCGEIGSHFVPPSLGDIGFFICDPPADIRNHSRL